MTFRACFFNYGCKWPELCSNWYCLWTNTAVRSSFVWNSTAKCVCARVCMKYAFCWVCTMKLDVGNSDTFLSPSIVELEEKLISGNTLMGGKMISFHYMVFQMLTMLWTNPLLRQNV